MKDSSPSLALVARATLTEAQLATLGLVGPMPRTVAAFIAAGVEPSGQAALGVLDLMGRGREAHKSTMMKAVDRDHIANMTGSLPSLTNGGALERTSSGRVERRW